MSRPLKTFSFVAFRQHWVGEHVPDIARQVYLVVAASSKAAAIRAMSPYVEDAAAWMRDRMTETGNEASVEAAMSEPGTVFVARDRNNPNSGFVSLPNVSIEL